MNAALALPEIFLSLAGLALLLFSAFRGEEKAGCVQSLALFSLAVAGVLLFWAHPDGLAFGGVFAADDFGRYFKALVLIVSALTLALRPAKGEVSVLVLFATLGMMLMVSAHNLIALYVGLELQNLALYVLVASQRDERRASEAALKYFTLGALSSGILLFGLSLLYGYTQTLCYSGLSLVLSGGTPIGPGLAAGIAFTLAGLAFKISAVPFHMWAPDVYEGAPGPITAFLAVVPKAAALALIVRLFADPLAAAVEVWRPLVVFFAVASMLLGAFAGLVQENIKRLMAYSGMINIGTMLVGLAVFEKGLGGIAGLEGLLLYLALYMFGVLAVFAVLLSFEQEGKPIEHISQLSGLAKTHPGLALAMGAALFSLTGIPPFAGFFGKYMVFLAAVKAGMLAVALVGVTLSVVAAGYYLRIVKVMYFDKPQGEALKEVPERVTRFVVVLTALAVTLFVLIPAPLMEVARQTAESFVGP